ncbi:peptidoglycan transglycosylase [Roseivivax halodurans JCM 10272]|uniref:Biosynthetic peptidoglycan transglycosylase n=1 Tax=Roseivivax halodurans JCM 10272 TaxID=1449350 RepID=X7EJP1_9RHOB|nr:monofunctional biosynthetic peptidoglycan transglycosylase [Roseivivax halodurans]ETX15358.1 peptidoglycan transglycosylase [Roseivivax halodurans JCM 10272]
MASKTGCRSREAGTATGKPTGAGARGLILRWAVRAVLLLVLLIAVAIGAYRVINPPTTLYMMQERSRLGNIVHDWTPADEIAPVMYRAAVAAEDANFCEHWGFDMGAIRRAIEDGGNRGASTISQQTVKNVYLWHGRTWLRKSLEAAITPGVEAVWPKRRILEVYLNVAEFGEGLFGVGEAAQYHFGVDASQLSSRQAALLAAVLPDPKDRDAGSPSSYVQRRAEQIRDGAATIDRDGRAECFQ